MVETAQRGVIAFGELMLCLTTRDHERFVQARDFDMRYTGAEANVAVSLSGFGVPAAVVSRVPKHEVGQACLNYLRQYGVDTTRVVRGGDRLGLLYVEQGTVQRASSVIYDREHSAFQEAQPDDFDWDTILTGSAWLHWSGTAPSRGPNVVRIIEQACEAARQLGVTVSCDINYRSRLWSVADAAPMMTALMDRVDVAFVGTEDAAALFGVCKADDDPVDAARGMRHRFGHRAVFTPVRDSGGTGPDRYGVLLYTDMGAWRSQMREVSTVGRIGAGDAMAAGAIYGLLRDDPPQRVVDFGAAAACLKHTIPGDFNLVTVAEVERLMSGAGGSRVQR